ncbi:trypsin-like peptidase domain-containing protein [Streptomyces sp. NPDC052051]|uniref:trypsin-like peptidase domain-containing protein n=1 Tax=Streptomyces sp. NPDC052051 TaxID=3154649 RepID=UPI003445DACA
MNEGKPIPPGQADAEAPEVRDGARPRAAANADGDFELERPAGATAPEPSDAVPAGTSVGAGADDGAGAVREPAVEEVVALPDREVQGREAQAAPVDRPKPLHDPDPYDTPPYGEPGPWAPAPPVQHPVATPAQGTAIQHPVATPAQGTPVPPYPPQGAPVPPASAPGVLAAAPMAPDAPVPVPPGTASDVPPGSPWQNYDPWAPQAPLQQSGASIATKEQRRKRARKVLVLGAVLIALAAGGVGGVVGAALERDGGVGDVQLPQAGQEAPDRDPDSVAGIAARALPGVVTLHVKGAGAEGTGTGFVLDERGHLLTNNHVVEPAGSGGEISVTFNSGETAKATVVGRDTGYDLAVVKVSGVHGLKPMPLGNSDNVQVGDPVVAIGAPFDLAGTVTSGIISAKERPITAGGKKGDGGDVSYVDALQTDAPINPGNSGGPLLDAKGRVVGINSAIRSADSGSGPTGQAGSIGLGFAIPVNQAKRVAEELINTGKATHPVIGVTLDMSYTGDGARVGAKGADGGPAVNQGGPGEKAGIKSGDVITEVDGVRVHSGEELIVKTRAHRPGDRLRLTVVRDGGQRKITLALGSADGS